MEIPSNTFIQFHLHSTKDLKLNASFSLKFIVRAYGFSKLTHKLQLNDLIESLTCLVGTHLARTHSERFHLLPVENSNEPIRNLTRTQSENLSASGDSATISQTDSKTNPFFAYQPLINAANAGDSLNNDANKTENNKIYMDYNSDVYRILFRGGIPNASKLSKSNQSLLTFLHKLFNFYQTIETEENTELREFLKVYDIKSFVTNQTAWMYAKGKAGGLQISELVLQIFTCLIWLQPAIKYEQLFKITEINTRIPIKHELVAQAFRTAESTRMFIIEQQHVFKFKTRLADSVVEKSLVEIIRAKLLLLLRTERLSERLLNYELSRQTSSSSSSEGEGAENQPLNNTGRHVKAPNCAKKKTSLFNRLPKCDPHTAYNLLFEFIFDKCTHNLDKLEAILSLKHRNAELVRKNFVLATTFLANATDEKNTKAVRSMEFVLTLLSSFFANGGSTMSCQPPSLKLNCVHYLQNLYGCGVELEVLVRAAYYEFVRALLRIDKRLREVCLNEDKSSPLIERLRLRMSCFIVNFVDIDWELFDWKFVLDTNLTGYLLRNAFNAMPIRNFVNEKNQTTSQVLEEVFKMSREDFNSNNIPSGLSEKPG